jgi:hypothetical protein
MKSPRPAAFRTLFGSRGFGRAAVTLAAALAIIPTSALAAANVSGSPQAVRIEAQNSSIEEILAALGRAFNVHYRSSADLKTQITGTYEGSLRRVVTRILEGHDFIVKSSPGGIEVTVLGTENAPVTSERPIAARAGPIPPAKPRLPAAPSQVAQQPGAAASDTASALAAPMPGMKLAEGPAPVPTPRPSASSLPAPVPDATASVAQPVPLAPGSATAPTPEPRPSNIAPPMPPLPGAGPANSPVPPAPTAHAKGPT